MAAKRITQINSFSRAVAEMCFFLLFYVQQIRSVFEQNKASTLQGIVVLSGGITHDRVIFDRGLLTELLMTESL